MRTLINSAAMMSRIPHLAKTLILPHLVAIYDATPNQIGTGFLVCRNGVHTLWTAKHTLFGHNLDEQPMEKLIFASKKLQPLCKIANSDIVLDDNVDLAMVTVKLIPGRSSLPFRCLQFSSCVPPVLTVIGFLSRDFHRSAVRQLLQPKPYIYTDTCRPASNDQVAMRYTRRAITSSSGLKELSPIPRGLSGSPIINSVSLLGRRQVEIFGVFTEYNADTSRGLGPKLSSVRFLAHGAH